MCAKRNRCGLISAALAAVVLVVIFSSTSAPPTAAAEQRRMLRNVAKEGVHGLPPRPAAREVLTRRPKQDTPTLDAPAADAVAAVGIEGAHAAIAAVVTEAAVDLGNQVVGARFRSCPG
jgi:hypothetical protein